MSTIEITQLRKREVTNRKSTRLDVLHVRKPGATFLASNQFDDEGVLQWR